MKVRLGLVLCAAAVGLVGVAASAGAQTTEAATVVLDGNNVTIDPAKPFGTLPVDMTKIGTDGQLLVARFERDLLPELNDRCIAISGKPAAYALAVVKFCNSVPGWMPVEYGNYR